MTSRTQHLTLSAMFMALGILIPILFHAVGLGSFFLPMFWPIAAAGFFLPVPFALMTGILTPVLSAMFTGMPPAPILYKMIFELGLLAGTISLLYRKTRIGLFWLALSGTLGALFIALLGAAALAILFDLPPRLYALISVGKGLPGILCILTIVLYVIHRLKSEPIFSSRNPHVQSP